MLLSEGQMSDYKGAALMLAALPPRSICSVTKAMTPVAPSPRAAHGMHPIEVKPKSADRTRSSALSSAAQDRKYVRKTQGLAANPHPL